MISAAASACFLATDNTPFVNALGAFLRVRKFVQCSSKLVYLITQAGPRSLILLMKDATPSVLTPPCIHGLIKRGQRFSAHTCWPS